MAHFRGEVDGVRSSTSRLGTKQSGIKTYTQAWGGEIVVDMWHSERFGDMVRIYVQDNPAQYGEHKPEVELFNGTLEALRKSEFKYLQVR